MTWQVPDRWKEAWRNPPENKPPHPFLTAAIEAELGRLTAELARQLDFDQHRRMVGDDPPRLHYPGAIDATAREVP